MKEFTCGIINGCSGHWHQAAKNAGYNVLWDYEPSWQRHVIEKNFPNDVVFANPKSALRSSVPDVICGSPPCTGFTASAGTKGKIRPDHEHNHFVVDWARMVAKLSPKMFVMEEVKNFLTVENRFVKSYFRILQKKYNMRYDVINAFNYGCPQTRHRAIFIGTLKPKKPEHTRLFNCVNIQYRYPLEVLKGVVPAETKKPKPGLAGCWSHLKTKQSRFNRTMQPKKPCHTLTGFCCKDILMPGGRYLAYNEAAVLMGFPESYDFGFLMPSYRGGAIGRGVPVELAEFFLLKLRGVGRG